VQARTQRAQSAFETLHSRFGFEGFLPGQQETIECVLSGRNVLTILPPRGGRSLCCELPSAILGGRTVVATDGDSAAGNPAGLPGDGISRVSPDQFYDSSVIERLSRSKVDLLAVEGAERLSQWSHRYSPSSLGIADAAAVLQPQATLALCTTASRDVQGDILYQLDILDAERVAAPLWLDGLFLESRMFDDAEARLDAVAELGGARDARVCVVVPDGVDTSRVCAQLALRGMGSGRRSLPAAAPIAVVHESDLPQGANADPTRMVFACLPASLDEWLTRIGGLVRRRRSAQTGRLAVSLFAVHGEVDSLSQNGGSGISAGDVVSLHGTVASQAQGGRLRIAEQSLCCLTRLDAETLAQALGHLVSLGAVARRCDPDARLLNLEVQQESLPASSISRIEQHLAKLERHRRLKVSEVADFVRSRECRTRLLAEATGLLSPKGPCSQCDNCTEREIATPGRSGRSRNDAEAAPARPAEQAKELVLECVRKLPLGIDKVDLVDLLSGTVSLEVGRQMDRDDFLGSLEALGGAAVRELVESMVAIGTLIERKIVVADKKVTVVEARDSEPDLGLRLPDLDLPREAFEPRISRIGAIDFDLLTALRQWRKSAAHRRRIRLNEIVLDSDLKMIAQAKPQTEEKLRDCVGMSWQRVKQWAREILSVVRSGEPSAIPLSLEYDGAPETTESLIAGLNTDDARAKVDAIRALKRIGDPRCYPALDKISLDLSEPLVVRLYAGIAKRAVLRPGRGEEPMTGDSVPSGNPIRLAGPWDRGVALSPSSEFVGGIRRRTLLGELVYRYKYEHDKAQIGRLAKIVAEHLRSLDRSFGSGWVIVPIPPSVGRPGGDPVAELAREVARLCDVQAAPGALVRSRPTMQQKDIDSFALKIANVRGSFSIADRLAVAGKDVVLLDDLIDSGATAKEAVSALKRAGASRVFFVALNKTVRSFGAAKPPPQAKAAKAPRSTPKADPPHGGCRAGEPQRGKSDADFKREYPT
jgi:superfamily II DNA helicase RecQ/predicted amidophosphoribosyltransferase